MRHLWVSVAILAGMVLLLSWNGSRLEQFAEPVCQEVTLAAQAVREGEWTQAESHTRTAKELWQARTGTLRYVQCHADLEEVSVLLEESEAFLISREPGEYLSRNAKLLGALQGLCEMEKLSAGNLF